MVTARELRNHKQISLQLCYLLYQRFVSGYGYVMVSYMALNLKPLKIYFALIVS